LRPAGRLCRAHRTKIVLQCQFANLRVQRLDVDRRFRARTVAASEYLWRSLQQLRLPGRDLVGVDVELRRQFRQCPITLDRRNSYLDLECR
jgi:hypothetical protein